MTAWDNFLSLLSLMFLVPLAVLFLNMLYTRLVHGAVKRPNIRIITRPIALAERTMGHTTESIPAPSLS